jgi:hypothetical protein
MKRKILTAARYLATVTGVVLIFMVFVASRNGTLDLASAMKLTMQNAENTLREWFSCFHFR